MQSPMSCEPRGAALTTSKPAKSRKVLRPDEIAIEDVDFPFADSVGYQVRRTHRALQRYLQLKIEPHGVTLGMWYFLRALWHEDGLNQRELSRRVGTMEPTTLSAILNMEKKGFVRRVQNKTDRRKLHVHLTPKGRALKAKLIPLAREVVGTAVQSLSRKEIKAMLDGLVEVQNNLHATVTQLDEINSKIVE
jgi:MarR family transcriptional regulator, organic hydroperoxide resistance regulator